MNGELIKALIKCQKEFAPLKKSAENPHFRNKFVPLHEVLENVLPILGKHGLAISQWPTVLEDRTPGLLTLLMHESGETLQYTMPLLLTKLDPQAQGSGITYARRYALMSVLGLVGDEDDDGTAATTPAKAKRNDTVRDGDPEALRVAKDQLRQLVANLPKDEQAQFSWVRQCTDVGQINEQITALRAIHG